MFSTSCTARRHGTLALRVTFWGPASNFLAQDSINLFNANTAFITPENMLYLSTIFGA